MKAHTQLVSLEDLSSKMHRGRALFVSNICHWSDMSVNHETGVQRQAGMYSFLGLYRILAPAKIWHENVY